MFKDVPVRAQLREVQKKNVVLEQEVKQNRADLDFVAIMADVEIPTEDDSMEVE